MIDVMELEPNHLKIASQTEMENDENVVRIKNENTEDSTLYLTYFLDEELTGKTVVECEEMKDRWTQVFGRKILGLGTNMTGELLMDKEDNRKYAVDMLVRRKSGRLLSVTIIDPEDEIEWDEKNMTLKVFGKKNRTIKFELFCQQP
jgi:hypothetical protein